MRKFKVTLQPGSSVDRLEKTITADYVEIRPEGDLHLLIFGPAPNEVAATRTIAMFARHTWVSVIEVPDTDHPAADG